jgi:chitin synthase
MVQSGWRLEYCAAAEDHTYCPETFDEFFKQRRRWIPSTLANLVQVIGEWKVTLENNDHISIFFIFYQALMVFSTLIA